MGGHEGSTCAKGDEEEGRDEGHEGHEEEGSHEGHEGDEEEGSHGGNEGDEEEGSHGGHGGDEEEGSHEGHEGHEEEGSHEGDEGDEEEVSEQGREGRHGQGHGASWKQGEDCWRLDCEGPQQEQVCTWQEVPMDSGRGEGSQGPEDHWLRCHQEGLTAVCQGKGVLHPVSAALSHLRIGSGKWRRQLQVWGFPQLWSAGAPASANCSDRWWMHAFNLVL